MGELLYMYMYNYSVNLNIDFDFLCFRNQNGGRWIISLDKRQRADHLDNYWLEILFFLIGEHADQHAHQVI